MENIQDLIDPKSISTLKNPSTIIDVNLDHAIKQEKYSNCAITSISNDKAHFQNTSVKTKLVNCQKDNEVLISLFRLVENNILDAEEAIERFNMYIHSKRSPLEEFRLEKHNCNDDNMIIDKKIVPVTKIFVPPLEGCIKELESDDDSDFSCYYDTTYLEHEVNNIKQDNRDVKSMETIDERENPADNTKNNLMEEKISNNNKSQDKIFNQETLYSTNNNTYSKIHHNVYAKLLKKIYNTNRNEACSLDIHLIDKSLVTDNDTNSSIENLYYCTVDNSYVVIPFISNFTLKTNSRYRLTNVRIIWNGSLCIMCQNIKRISPAQKKLKIPQSTPSYTLISYLSEIKLCSQWRFTAISQSKGFVFDLSTSCIVTRDKNLSVIKTSIKKTVTFVLIQHIDKINGLISYISGGYMFKNPSPAFNLIIPQTIVYAESEEVQSKISHMGLSQENNNSFAEGVLQLISFWNSEFCDFNIQNFVPKSNVVVKYRVNGAE